jgi:phage-related protein
MASFPTTTAPTFSMLSREYSARVLVTQFGDGYRQRAADGINAIGDTYNVGWENITTSEKNTIRDFLVTCAGWDAFVWTAPGDTASQKWTCVTWKETPKGAGYWSFTAVFRKEFDV